MASISAKQFITAFEIAVAGYMVYKFFDFGSDLADDAEELWDKVKEGWSEGTEFLVGKLHDIEDEASQSWDEFTSNVEAEYDADVAAVASFFGYGPDAPVDPTVITHDDVANASTMVPSRTRPNPSAARDTGGHATPQTEVLNPGPPGYPTVEASQADRNAAIDGVNSSSGNTDYVPPARPRPR